MAGSEPNTLPQWPSFGSSVDRVIRSAEALREFESSSRVDTLREWARFESIFAGLIGSAEALREFEYGELRKILERSEQLLAPLGEPLTQNIGLNRWLVQAREETYSDWLKWLFEQMEAGELIKVLDLGDLLAEDQPSVRARVSVAREVIVEEGHDRHHGRIDLVLEVGQWGHVILEVKMGNAAADPDKLIGYKNSVERNNAFRPKAYVLIAASSDTNTVHGFHVRLYPRFCRNLRHLAIKRMHCDPPQLFSAATTLMLVAAIEINLLNLSAHEGSFSVPTLCHLRKFVKEGDYE